ncbi:MAG: hypothetical protein GY861_06865 [bacterium]|nr:hypothetical protein [bacterium]
MKKKILAVLLIFLMCLQIVAVSALTGSEAKQAWQESKIVSKDKQAAHRAAKIAFVANRTDLDLKQEYIDTGKESMHAALDEVEAWLVWKKVDAEENVEIPEDLKDTIIADADANIAKVDDLRTDVDGIDTELEMGLVFIKMVVSYLELLTDVARDTGKVLVWVGNERLDTSDAYEAELRAVAEGMDNNEATIAKLDTAKEDLEKARGNVANAEDSYDMVVVGGTPLIKFGEGNSYMRTARANLLSAHANLNQAFALISRGG